MIPYLTAATFQRFLSAAPLPVAVKFFSPTCPACIAAKPAFLDMERRWRGWAVFAAVNVDADPVLSQREGVRAIPTFAVYVGGRKWWTVEGFDAGTVGRIEDALRSNRGRPTRA